MAFAEHPLRRRYSAELALGITVAAFAAWLLLGRDTGTRGNGTRGNGARETGARVESRANPAAEERGTAEPALASPQAAPDERPARAAVAAEGSAAATDRSPASEEPAEEPEAALTVLVLDADGIPAEGVLLRLDLETTPRSSGPRGMHLCTTDANGSALVPLGWFARPDSLPGHSLRNVLVASVPLSPAPRIDFGAMVPAPGLVTMRLPPAGHMLVRVNEDDGTPVASRATVYASSTSGLSFNAEVREGVASFRWIGLGERIDVRAVHDDQHARASSRARTTLAGPAWPGETVEGELVLGLEWPLVTFRVLDEHGRALGFANLRLRVDEDPLAPQDAFSVADAAGRAELRLLGHHLSQYVRTLELATTWPVERRARVVLPAELERGRATDLGAIVLHPSR